MKGIRDEISDIDEHYRTVPLPMCCASDRGLSIRNIKEREQDLQSAIQTLSSCDDGRIKGEPNCPESIRRWEHFCGSFPAKDEYSESNGIPWEVARFNGFPY